MSIEFKIEVRNIESEVKDLNARGFTIEKTKADPQDQKMIILIARKAFSSSAVGYKMIPTEEMKKEKHSSIKKEDRRGSLKEIVDYLFRRNSNSK